MKPHSSEIFPQKLWHLLQYDPTTAITWLEDGSGFRILDIKQMEEEILLKYFKRKLLLPFFSVSDDALGSVESKIRSFFRQLNVYGFVRCLDPCGLSKFCFNHPQFHRSHPELLSFVQRRKPSSHRPSSVLTYCSTPDDCEDSDSSCSGVTRQLFLAQSFLGSFSSSSDSGDSSASLWTDPLLTEEDLVQLRQALLLPSPLGVSNPLPSSFHKQH